MHVEQLHFSGGRWWSALDAGDPATDAQLVLVFGDRDTLSSGQFLPSLRDRFPGATVVSCSGGGAILGGHVVDEGLTATALKFAQATVNAATLPLPSSDASDSVGEALAMLLPHGGLRHVLIFAEGLHVNGTALSRGLSRGLPAGVTVTGGLAADGERFEATVVGLDETPASDRVVAVGLYGSGLRISIGSFGGWETFGIDRLITRSSGNTLHELDGQPVLELYKELLGPLGYALPASGLLFPLEVRASLDAPGVIRTILGIDAEAGSVTFAGDVPEGSYGRLVRTNLDQLIEAAGTAAGQTTSTSKPAGESLAIAVSCIGRKLLLQRRVDEELASVREVLGDEVKLAGFYAYGELAPSAQDAPCELHNQTMTITTISEA